MEQLLEALQVVDAQLGGDVEHATAAVGEQAAAGRDRVGWTRCAPAGQLAGQAMESERDPAGSARDLKRGDWR